MKIGNTTLIPQNIAPPEAKKVAICDESGNVLLSCELGHLAQPQVGEKLYSVGLLSDTHTRETQYDTETERITDAQADLTTAMQYFSTVADMTCVCGDLAHYQEALGKHKEIVDAYKGDMEVLEMAGNHEHFSYITGTENILTDEDMRQYTGHPLQYVFEKGEDVFIMCGAVRWSSVFNQESIQWLYETLEENRNRRCFLFIHCFLPGGQYCGDSTGIVNTIEMMGGYKQAFINLLNHYKNVIYFHGHSHVMGQMQEYAQKLKTPLPVNYDFSCGIHSVHIPSLAVPRDISTGSRLDVVGESQGYLMDVYQNHVVLRGRDFIKGAFIPIATYCLDTTLQTIDANTFTDSAGIIVTG